ncbi:MAG TPA: 6-phosphogluconolactonase, partial [Limnochordia bacterium]|nr:6-phosphogluconolactonase [Limnochordia bacterium]
LRDRSSLGRAAAERIAECLRVRSGQERIRMAFAAAPSQDEFYSHLTALPGLPWERIEAFQLDDYVGLGPEHPASFAAYLREHIFAHVPVGRIHVLDGRGDAQAAARAYADRLAEAPLDICCLGIGENGHLAFNDPPVADFADPQRVKVVELDAACRTQQVNDGCFPSLAEVPTHALTLTIPALMSAAVVSVVVPGPRKRAAVTQTVRGPIATACPASILRRHPAAVLWLDRDAAAGL